MAQSYIAIPLSVTSPLQCTLSELERAGAGSRRDVRSDASVVYSLFFYYLEGSVFFHLFSPDFGFFISSPSPVANKIATG